MDPAYPVVIAGAGPVGLSAALALARLGVRSLVLESKPAPSPHSRAPGIHARTMELFRAWGVLDRFLERGVLVLDAAVWVVGAAAPAVRVEFGQMRRWTATPGVLLLPQNRTEEILVAELGKAGGEVRFAHRLVDYRQDGEGVTVRIQPADGAAYEVRAAYLVGCDGAHSAVRERLGFTLEGKTYPSRLLLADVVLPDGRARDLPWPRLAPRRAGALGAVRLEDDLWRVIATCERHEPEGEPDAEALRARVEALFGPGPFELRWSSVFRIHCRTSPRFRVGRVLLAGDAAHVNSPVGGQGMNAGIHDAHNLACKLARVLGGGHADNLLDAYEHERRAAIVDGVDRYTDLLTRLLLLAPPGWLRRLSLGLARAVAGNPWLLRRVLPKEAMLDTAYPRSRLLSGRGALIGRRAPDADLVEPGGRTVRLHELCFPGAVLVAFDAGGGHRLDLVAWEAEAARAGDVKFARVVPRRTRGVVDAYRDVSGTLWKDWRARHGTVALVRPDGHVAWVARRPSPFAVRGAIARALDGYLAPTAQRGTAQDEVNRAIPLRPVARASEAPLPARS